MSHKDRAGLIQKIEQERNSRVITYYTSDRGTFPGGFSLPALKTQLHIEAQPLLYDVLRQDIGRTEKLDLLLYTRGGQTDSVWPLVSLFREFAQHFNVLVPFRAHSAGTLICLGADEVIMAEAAEWSSVDPTTGNQFNPVDEVDKKTRRGISVEDVISFIELAKDSDKVGLREEEHIASVFNMLSRRVHPLALGNVYRIHTQIRKLSTMLLELHLEDKTGIEAIVNALTQEMYSHSHAINRHEAKKLCGNGMVRDASPAEQELLWALHEEYSEALKLRDTLCVAELADRAKNEPNHAFELDICGGYIETTGLSGEYKSRSRVTARSQLPQGIKLQIPPGQPLPLIPGAPVSVDAEVLSIGWRIMEPEVEE